MTPSQREAKPRYLYHLASHINGYSIFLIDYYSMCVEIKLDLIFEVITFNIESIRMDSMLKKNEKNYILLEKTPQYTKIQLRISLIFVVETIA
jgi:hypothetical protein